MDFSKSAAVIGVLLYTVCSVRFLSKYQQKSVDKYDQPLLSYLHKKCPENLNSLGTTFQSHRKSHHHEFSFPRLQFGYYLVRYRHFPLFFERFQPFFKVF